MPLPGPSAVATLISISGIRCNTFYFVGFLPKKESEKINCFKCPENSPLLFFETAKRLKATLTTLETHFPVSELCLGKELSKTFETIFKGSVTKLMKTIKKSEIKGEWVGLLTFDHNKLYLDYENKTIQELKKENLSMKQTKKIAKLLGISANKATHFKELHTKI